VDVAREGVEGLHLALENDYAVIVLDVMLPGLDGFGVLRALRARKQTPVIMLTARERVEDRIRGLREGADDYLGKPFSFLELVARLQALTRRSGGHEPVQVTVADLWIDLISRKASRNGMRLDLTAKEFSLLSVLARRQGKSCPRPQLRRWSGTSISTATPTWWKWRSSACAPSSTGRSTPSCCTPSVAWAMCWRAAVSTNSIALRLSGMFTLVALLIFLLIGGALYQQVDRGLGLLPEAELDARYSVLESSVTRFGTPEHWVKIKAKLKLLAKKTSASVSGW
jgi:CheY-like chemotaxis protein